MGLASIMKQQQVFLSDMLHARQSRFKTPVTVRKLWFKISKTIFITLPSEAEIFQNQMMLHFGFESLRKCCSTTESHSQNKPTKNHAAFYNKNTS